MNEDKFDEITEEVYGDIAGYLAEGTDSDDAVEIKKAIRAGLKKVEEAMPWPA